MHSNLYGQVYREESEAIELLYQNPDLDITKINFSQQEVVDRFNQSAKLCELPLRIHKELELTIPLEDFDKTNQVKWFMPEDYCPNLVELIYDRCKSDEERDRVSEELELFIKHGMLDLLHYMKYLVDTFRANNIVWGVGRGSSVASYVLYLIGVHKINSLKYNLDIGEFLK